MELLNTATIKSGVKRMVKLARAIQELTSLIEGQTSAESSNYGGQYKLRKKDVRDMFGPSKSSLSANSEQLNMTALDLSQALILRYSRTSDNNETNDLDFLYFCHWFSMFVLRSAFL